MTEIITYIGLGSNMESPIDQVRSAVQELSVLPSTRLIAQSSLYRTPPMGPQDQPDYINAVVGLATGLALEDLLQQLQQIEQLHQRKRLVHWGPRTLDLDILLYGQDLHNSERLQVPHPGLAQRIFVLHPLLEIAPQLILPDGTRLAAYAEKLVGLVIERLNI